MRERILFLCTGNSCRSQMAEGFTRALRGGEYEAYSAGVARHGLNPCAAKAMAEAGVDISGQKSTLVEELPVADFDIVVTLCGHARENCPYFPGKVGRRAHKGFDDPARHWDGGECTEKIMPHYRRVRDQIRTFIQSLPTSLDPDTQ